MITTTSKCVHHWKLTRKDRSIMHGKCQLCGAEQDYPAHLGDALAKNKKRWTAGAIKKRERTETIIAELKADRLKLRC